MTALQRDVERRAPEIKRAELPLLQANDAGAFSGYASLFGVVDSGGDMVMTGAFARSLDQARRAGRENAVAASGGRADRDVVLDRRRFARPQSRRPPRSCRWRGRARRCR